VIPFNWSLDHAGPMARTAADCALILQAIAGYDDDDPTSIERPVPDYVASLGTELNGVRIGLPHGYFFDRDVYLDREPVPDEVTRAVRDAASTFEGLGATVSEVAVPSELYAMDDAFLADGAAYHEANLREHPEAYSEPIRRRFEGALELKATDYSRSRYFQLEFKRSFARLFREIDLLLTPTVPIVAPEIPDDPATIISSVLLRNTWPFNITGSPAMSIPCGFSAGGLPIGLQLTGRDWEEALVLRAAHAYQQATDWHLRLPPLQ
jgi:Asp-tRNA(Asn)/Glu-tRNA(Gln) amidotransferase A subunit family amidase